MKTIIGLIVAVVILSVTIYFKNKQIKELEYRLKIREHIINVRTDALRDCSNKLHELTN